jgi:hypothetical protein
VALWVSTYIVDSPIRLVSDGGPLQLDASNATDFVRGKNALVAPIFAEIKAGSTISFNWVGVDRTPSASFPSITPMVFF